MAFTATRTRSMPSKWLTLLAVCLGLMMLMIDTFVVNIAFPAISRGLHAGLGEAEWTVSGYVLVMGVLPIAMGRLGDLYGRRRLYLLGLALFVGSSIACGLSQSIGALIVFRVAQGAGAAIMTPLTLSIVTHAFPAAQRGLAIGIWGGVSGLGLIAGPILGGLLVRGDNWRWIFFINVPVGLLAFVLALPFVPESRDETAPRGIDWGGLTLLSAALFLLVYGLTRANELGWGSPVLLGSLLGGAALLPVFVALERRVQRPLIELSLFRSRTFVIACLAAFLFNAGVFGSQPYSSLLLQNTWGFSPLEAGFAFVPATALVALMTPVSGMLGQRLGGRLRLVMIAGSLLVAVSALYLLRLDVRSGYADTFLPAFVIRGAGIGLFIAVTSLAVMSAVPVAKAGLASGTLTMARQIGTSLGVALLGGVYLNHVDGALSGASSGAPQQAAVRRAAEHFLPAGTGAAQAAARQAIVDGFVRVSLFVALLSVAAALAAVFIRHRAASDPAPESAPAAWMPSAVAADPLPAAVLD
ncbi:MAG TPA: DHA2 family efflux MFS transporter permease subunit [Dehalococcoidia bacterium]|nr:DHA2 family efflux MFS transporter permease subunit [Dehalococcoidia bacterium]